jgi:hypothetical protein
MHRQFAYQTLFPYVHLRHFVGPGHSAPTMLFVTSRTSKTSLSAMSLAVLALGFAFDLVASAAFLWVGMKVASLGTVVRCHVLHASSCYGSRASRDSDHDRSFSHRCNSDGHLSGGGALTCACNRRSETLARLKRGVSQHLSSPA